MLNRHGQDVDTWDLEKYADAAYSWMRRAALSHEGGEKKWAKIERDLWKGVHDPKRYKQQVKDITDMLSGLGSMGQG